MERIRELFLMDPEKINREIDPYFNEYFKGYKGQAGSRKFLRRCERIHNTISPKDGYVLDVACGFGIYDFYMALSGARMVIGVDLEKNKAFNRIKKILRVENVVSIKGSANSLMLAENSMDAVVATDAISHINDTEAFFLEVYRVLKPGGIFFIEDSSGLNRRMIHFLEPQYATVRKVYWSKRRRMIAEWFPDLPGERLDYLTDMTKGLWAPEIRDAVENYLETGRITRREKDDIREPDTGYWMEKLWDPYYIRKLLFKCGFSTVRINAFDHRLQDERDSRSVKDCLRRMVSRLPTPIALHILVLYEVVARK